MTEKRNDWLRIFWRTAKYVVEVTDKRNLSLIAAGIAFFSMLAVFPGLAALISIWGLFADPGVISEQLVLLKDFLPPGAYGILSAQISALVSASGSTLGLTTFVSLLLALWSARAGIAALIRGLNAIYGTRSRPGLWHYGTAMLLTIALIAVGLVALGSVVAVPIIFALLPDKVTTSFTLELLRWGSAVLVVIFGLGIVYRFGPNRRIAAKVSWVSPGAIVALIIWGGLSYAFSHYLANFGRYNEVYGSIGAVVALLVWFYISAYVILMGAAVNAYLEYWRLKKERRPVEPSAADDVL